MRTYEIEVLSDGDSVFVEDILKALEQKHIVKFKQSFKENVLSGKPFSEQEFDNLLEKASKSRSYSYEEAKLYLNL